MFCWGFFCGLIKISGNELDQSWICLYVIVDLMMIEKENSFAVHIQVQTCISHLKPAWCIPDFKTMKAEAICPRSHLLWAMSWHGTWHWVKRLQKKNTLFQVYVAGNIWDSFQQMACDVMEILWNVFYNLFNNIYTKLYPDPTIGYYRGLALEGIFAANNSG